MTLKRRAVDKIAIPLPNQMQQDLARLGVMWGMKADLERRIVTLADQLHGDGFEWTDLAAQAGTSRQNFTGWVQRRRAAYSRSDGADGDGQAA